MACIEDQQPTFKHFCRICKKGFMCGRALGGHMRAHGIGDESGNLDDEDQASDWEDKVGGGDRGSNRRMYALRTNPNRLKSCRNCENCGKEFLSWKSFLEHGKCNSEDAESLVSSPESEGEEDDGGRRGCGWSKRKRSFRAKVGSFNSLCANGDEDLILAQCLMSLSNPRVDQMVAEPEESCASASKDEERRNPLAFLMPLASQVPLDKAKGVARGMFECKACKKVFNSHQALGGHRASHKKVKGCFASKQYHIDDGDEDLIRHQEFFPPKSTFEQGYNAALAGVSRRKSKVHECSICHRIFSTGQALGGHKRCHWLTSNAPETSSLPTRIQQFHDQIEQMIQKPQSEGLDLNLPAPFEDLAGIRRDPRNPLSFEISTEIHLHPWNIEVDGEGKNDSSHCHHHHLDDQNNNIEDEKENINKDASTNGVLQNVDDEADSKVKLAKLSDLKDMTVNGGSSAWLKVGMGSITDVGADP